MKFVNHELDTIAAALAKYSVWLNDNEVPEGHRDRQLLEEERRKTWALRDRINESSHS